MNASVQLAATVLGGLALFVYGMGLMSDGLKETAGEKLKAALGYIPATASSRFSRARP